MPSTNDANRARTGEGSPRWQHDTSGHAAAWQIRDGPSDPPPEHPVGAAWEKELVRASGDVESRQRLSYARPDTVEAFSSGVGTPGPVPEPLAKALSLRPVARATPVREGLGTFVVSRIGVNATATEALVYVYFGYGRLCGSGHFVLLGRDGSGWRAVKVDLYAETWFEAPNSAGALDRRDSFQDEPSSHKPRSG